ncbi:uncharacterized protein EI90DRAFT_1099712 [Cantharellus anzutake]|uniref:uncharacterized protein n=1 Tax=Cantharellus anzutake TaxID=1750568 RepID=UPI001908D6E0|nr:uncharacterized protein EI90DRAFT_1099712 [Cantharellus anzutake]KAF8330813.1 hypothetical protein EI90DRAFT_1099712 [Cantharellus anzutake]
MRQTRNVVSMFANDPFNWLAMASCCPQLSTPTTKTKRTTSTNKANLVNGSYPSPETDGSRSPVDKESDPNTPPGPPDAREFSPDAAGEEERKAHTRRAKFLRYQEYKSGVIYDLDIVENDLAAPAYDEMWRWDEWTSGGIAFMSLWWFLESTPFISLVQDKHTLSCRESKLRHALFGHFIAFPD